MQFPEGRRPLAAASIVAGVVAVAGSFAVTGATPRFIATPVSDWVVRTTPAVVVTAAIENLGSVGKLIGFAFALALLVALLSVAAGVGAALGARLGTRWTTALGGAIAVWGVAYALTAAPVGALGAAAPAAVALFVFPAPGTQPTRPSRRRVVISAAAVVGFLGLSTWLGTTHNPVTTEDLPGVDAAEIDERLRLATRRSLDVDGLDPLLSAIGAFYEVDIATINPNPAVENWRLSVTGAVETEVTVTFDDVTAFDPDHRFITLRCVGEQLNGELMDNALWTGIPASAITDQAGVLDTATHVQLRSLDDYEVAFPIEAFRDAFLAYGMNGQRLPRAHGFPLRALIPGHWGETNAKWLTEIEFLTMARDGYWERRGWHGTGPVNTVAKLHVENHHDDGTIEVGGHAYAGTRGIETVEVSTDGGATWADAVLSEPLPGTDVWRQWVHTYEASDTHEVVVRAIDGTGMVQTETPSSPFPSGPTGLVRRTVRP